MKKVPYVNSSRYYEGDLSIHCQILPTTKPLDNDIFKQSLDTKLRQIDIHQHQLRQEVQNKSIKLQSIPTTTNMPTEDRLYQIVVEAEALHLGAVSRVTCGKSPDSCLTSLLLVLFLRPG
jgi:hypothetical protein